VLSGRQMMAWAAIRRVAASYTELLQFGVGDCRPRRGAVWQGLFVGAVV